MAQAFGQPPSSGAPAHSYQQQAGTIMCELLQQHQFRHTYEFKAELENYVWGAMVGKTLEDALVDFCASAEQSAALFELALKASSAPARGEEGGLS